MADSTHPVSPPASPTIPVGIGTGVGLTTSAAAFIGGFVSIFIDGDLTTATITAFAIATVTLVTTLIGRFAQAYAAYRDAPTARDKINVALDELRDLIEEADAVVNPEDYPVIDIADEQRDLHDSGA